MVYSFDNEEEKMKKPNLYGFCSYCLLSHSFIKELVIYQGDFKLVHRNKSNLWKFLTA